jgi:hypothetical protein
MSVLLLMEILAWVVGVLSIIVCIWGFANFEEWEMGIEFLPKNYNNFELGVSNRNYELVDDGLEQELRIGMLLFTIVVLFRRFDA